MVDNALFEIAQLQNELMSLASFVSVYSNGENLKCVSLTYLLLIMNKFTG